MSKILSLDPDQLSVPERHGYLLSAVAPRPIAFASTIDKDGKVNLSPFSFFNVFSSNPPIMIFSPARSGRDNTTKHTFDNVKEVDECVISIVNFPMVEQMSLASSQYPKGVNEFLKAGFTQVKSDLVAPPRVGESPVNFECKVQQIIELGDAGGAGNLVICRVVKMHINTDYLDEKGRLDTQKLDLVGRMGGIWYCHANGESLFEIPKPLSAPGIGIDSLPESIRQSEILSANDLGRLGHIEAIPNQDEIKIMKDSDYYKRISDRKENANMLKTAIHTEAKKLLAEKNLFKAMSLLLTVSE